MQLLSALAGGLLGLLAGLAVWLLATRRLHRENERLRIEIAGAEKEREATAEKLRWSEEAEQRLREAFTALASRALRENSDTLSKQAQNDLKHVVEPLKENLTTLSEHVRQLEKDRKGAYDGLLEQVKNLGETHARLQATTISLTQALRSPTVRGRWGELQLRRVVELAGMTAHVSFDEQASGDMGRPDLIVYLPNGGILPIDSKVPLNAYLSAMETSDPDQRRDWLARHAKALRERVRELGQKQYWDQFPAAPDFVVMFVPNEACLGAAFENDAQLLEGAIQKRVLISSPVNLIALLRAVAYGWQQHEITDNARKIAAEGTELYRRMELFVRHFAKVGRELNQTVDTYNKTIGSYERRLAPAARRLREMGLATEEISAPAPVDVSATLPIDSDAAEADGAQDIPLKGDDS